MFENKTNVYSVQNQDEREFSVRKYTVFYWNKNHTKHISSKRSLNDILSLSGVVSLELLQCYNNTGCLV